MSIKNLVLGLFLLGVTATPMAFAGSNGASGNGCAITQSGQTVTVTTALDSQGIVNELHGNVEAGTLITRNLTFNYNLSDVVDANCAYGLIDLGIANIVDTHNGPIQLNSISYTDGNSSTDLSNGSTVTLQQAGGKQTGTITMALEYEVKTPTKLAEAFDYTNSFDLVLKAGKTP